MNQSILCLSLEGWGVPSDILVWAFFFCSPICRCAAIRVTCRRPLRSVKEIVVGADQKQKCLLDAASVQSMNHVGGQGRSAHSVCLRLWLPVCQCVCIQNTLGSLIRGGWRGVTGRSSIM